MPRTEPQNRKTTRRAPVSERRALAIDTYLDLILEGNLPPTVEQVAERSRISVATLFRYFQNLDELRTDASQRAFERFPDLWIVPDIGKGTRDDRIRRLASVRLELWENVNLLARLQRTMGLREEGAREMIEFGRKVMADQIRAHFAPELRTLGRARREDAVATIATITSVESWEQFRLSHGRSPAQTQRAWIHAIEQALSD